MHCRASIPSFIAAKSLGSKSGEPGIDSSVRISIAFSIVISYLLLVIIIYTNEKINRFSAFYKQSAEISYFQPIGLFAIFFGAM